MGRTGFRVALVAAAAFVAVTHSATASKPHSIVGNYSIVTQIRGLYAGMVKGNLNIDSYNPSNGAISGHGGAERASYSMTGTVTGMSITMRVTRPGAAEIDRGTISPDGTITGTLHGSAGGIPETGTWVMKRLAANVVVRGTGLTQQHVGQQSSNVSWGVVLKNTSRTHDAVGVTLTVTLLGSNGKVIPAQGLVTMQTLAVIPAAQTFYFGGDSTLFGAVTARGLRVSVTIGSTPPKQYGLPPVAGVHLDASSRLITGMVRNTYSTSINPYDYVADMVLFDRHGQVIGGTGVTGFISHLDHEIKPGASRQVSFFLPDEVSPSRVASAQITVFLG